jgi:hypothetical protein
LFVECFDLRLNDVAGHHLDLHSLMLSQQSVEEERVPLRIQSLCIDTTDPAALAAFWEQALGWRRTRQEPTAHRSSA